MGLEGARVLFVNISVIGEDWGAGYHLHVNGGILGLFIPKRGIVILILRDKRILMTYTSGTPVTPRTQPNRVLTLSNTLVAVEVSRDSEG